MRVTPVENPESAEGPEAGAAPAATPAKAVAPAAAGGGKQAAGETLRAAAAKAAGAGRNRGSAPEGSEAEESEESEGGEAAGTAAGEKAEGREEGVEEGGTPSKSVRRRLRLAKRTSAAAAETSSEVAALKAQVEMLAGIVAGKPQNGATGPVKPKAFESPKFSETFPEDGTAEQQESWRLRKTVHETALPLARAMAEGIVTDQLQKYTELLSPLLDDYVTKARSTQVERARPQLEELGWDMDEVLDAARGIVAKNPQLPMEAAIGLVVFGGQDEAVPAPAEEVKKIPSRAGRVVETPSGRSPAGPRGGIFNNSWRSQNSELARFLKERAASSRKL